MRIAIVVSRFNDFVTDQLLTGAQEALRERGVAESDIEVLHVPGAFEVPIAAQRVAETGRVAAVVCLGCIVRGQTPHFEYLASAVALGIETAAGATGVPMAFGVLTTNSIEEAIERAGEGPSNKGWEAAAAAIDMVAVVAELKQAT